MVQNVVARNNSQKATFLFVLLVALAALFPVQAYAAEVGSAAELRTALASGGDIKLTGDITGGPFTVNEGITATIDLNGHTINRGLTSAAGNGYVISVVGTLTVTDASSEQNGKITGGWNSNGFGGAIDVVNGASFTLAGGSITGNVVSNREGFGGGVFVDNGATFTMTGGEISYCSAGSEGTNSNGYGGAVAVAGVFEMTGGYIYECGILNDKLSSTAYGGAVAIIEGGTFTLDGGTIGADKAGTLHGNQANQQGGAVYVQKRENNAGDTSAANTFEFTSGTITSSSVSGSGAGAVYNGDTFTMTDGTIEQTTTGAAVLVDENGTFAMSGGAIQKNSATGVVVNSGGTFTMTAGGIVENSGAFGGGVRIDGGTFDFSNGAIADNAASYAGGGVYISPSEGGVFNMTSGNIANNKVTSYNDSASLGYGNGGGVWVGKGAFKMSGGYITGNQSCLTDSNGGHAALGGGVWVNGADATFEVSGGPTIQSNTVGGSSFTSNVKLNADARIVVNDTELSGAQIGVTPFVSEGSNWGNTAVEAFQFKEGADDNIFSSEAVSEGALTNFTSDVEPYSVVRHRNDNYAQLLIHNHDWEFKNFTWTGNDSDGYTAVANYTCQDDESHTQTVNATVTSTTEEPSCEEGGKTTYTATVGAAESLDGSKHTEDKVVEIEALDHDWGYPAYEWAADNSTVTATRICRLNDTHKETETVNTTSEVTKEPTTTETGTRTYTATFTKEGFETVTKDVDIPKLPIKLTIVGSSIDGEEIAEDFEVEVASGVSVKNISEGVRNEILARFTMEDYFPYHGDNYVMRQPLSEYSSWSEVEEEDEEAYSMELTEDTTLYLALAKKVDTVEFTVEPPVCGTEVVFEGYDAETLENQPVLSGNNDQIELPIGLWVDREAEEMFNGTIVGGNSYTATVSAEPVFGYAFDEDEKKLPSITVNGADEGSFEFDMFFGDAIWLFFSVTAEHEWGEGEVTTAPTIYADGVMTYKCKHFDTCGGIKTEPIPKLTPITLTLVGSSIDEKDVAEDFEIEVASGSSVSDIPDEELQEIIAHFTEGDYFPYNGAIYVTQKPLSEFSSWDDVRAEDEEAHQMALTEDTTLYVVLAKRVDKIELTVQPPVCGSKVDAEKEENMPVLSDYGDQIEPHNSWWGDAEKSEIFEGTIVGGRSYTALVAVWPVFGYQFDENNPPAITVNGADEGSVKVGDVISGATGFSFAVTAEHDWGEWTETPPTCTEAGEKTRVCAYDESHKETREGAAALGHDWGEWVVTKEATETEEGEETRTCARCGETETRPIDKLNPQPQPDPDPDPTPEPKPTPSPDPTPSSISYRNTEGNGNVWVKGSGVTSDFTFKRSEDDSTTFDHFTGIQIDGNDVDASNYTHESGSVIVMLKPAYLETLALGKHTITALFDDGNPASANFTVVQKKAATPAAPSKTAKAKQSASPSVAGKTANTGDSAPLAPLCALVLLAVVVMIGCGRVTEGQGDRGTVLLSPEDVTRDLSPCHRM